MKHVAGLVAVLLVCVSAPPSIAQQQQPPLSLKEARQIALANRPLVKAADLSVAGARQNTIQVQSARYPQLSASIKRHLH